MLVSEFGSVFTGKDKIHVNVVLHRVDCFDIREISKLLTNINMYKLLVKTQDSKAININSEDDLNATCT